MQSPHCAPWPLGHHHQQFREIMLQVAAIGGPGLRLNAQLHIDCFVKLSLALIRWQSS